MKKRVNPFTDTPNVWPNEDASFPSAFGQEWGVMTQLMWMYKSNGRWINNIKYLKQPQEHLLDTVGFELGL